MRFARPLVLLTAFLAALLGWPTLAGAAPAITVTRSQVPGETGFTARLSGFAPGEAIALRLTADGAAPQVLDLPTITILADGTYTLSLLSIGLLGGDYTLVARRGTAAVASATFTVPPRATPTRPPIVATPSRTAPTPPPTGNGGALPGLPNTGGGGGEASGPSPLPGVPLLALLMGGIALARRARTRRPSAVRAAVQPAQNGRPDGR